MKILDIKKLFLASTLIIASVEAQAVNIDPFGWKFTGNVAEIQFDTGLSNYVSVNDQFELIFQYDRVENIQPIISESFRGIFSLKLGDQIRAEGLGITQVDDFTTSINEIITFLGLDFNFNNDVPISTPQEISTIRGVNFSYRNFLGPISLLDGPLDFINLRELPGGFVQGSGLTLIPQVPDSSSPSGFSTIGRARIGNLTATYLSTPVNEPSPIALISLGVLPLWLVRRSINRRNRV